MKQESEILKLYLITLPFTAGKKEYPNQGFSPKYKFVYRVRKYIDNQEERYRKIFFKEEYDGFIIKYRFICLG